MLAQITLTPTESKKLIAKAILNLPEVQSALKNGIITIHPSSSTFFIYREILGREPPDLWVIGVISPEGLTNSQKAADEKIKMGPVRQDPLMSKHAWFFKKGVLQEHTPLGEILNQMKEGDVYIKGCNALDPQGNAGVLFSNPAGGGGTIGKVMIAQRKKKFHLILPVGIEKLIPVSIQKASKKAGYKKIDKPMGLRCGLIPVPGKRINEIDALFLLTGVEATPIAAGGLGGAEGSIVLTCDGNEDQIQKLINVVLNVKGARLPTLSIASPELMLKWSTNID